MSELSNLSRERLEKYTRGLQRLNADLRKDVAEAVWHPDGHARPHFDVRLGLESIGITPALLPTPEEPVNQDPLEKPEGYVELKRDLRPQKDWWAPGSYGNTCVKCGDGFIGDKRAGICADCAYDDSYRIFGRLMWKLIKKYGEEFCWDEWSEEVLPLAEKAGICRRVKYDPEKHGEIEADPGCEIWFWGEELNGEIKKEESPTYKCTIDWGDGTPVQEG